MKKRAFTMAEIIITLAVIAVGSILIAPTITNIMPDNNKAKIIKYNTLLGNAINEMFQDENLYHPIYYYDENLQTTVERRGINDLLEENGIENFGNELIDAIGVDGLTKIGPDNSHWTIMALGDPIFSVSIFIDLKPDRPGCMYSDVCNKPREVDTYSFIIDAEGSVIPNDNLTRAYLSNPLVLNNRKEDFEKAASY